MKKFLAFDIGGTAIKYGLFNQAFEMISKGSVKTPHESLEVFVETLGEIFDKYQEEVSGIAVSLPGVLDAVTGQMFTGGSLSYNQGINFIEVVSKRCPVPITIENDGKCAALAEL